jgi:pilus assembly protein CpaF
VLQALNTGLAGSLSTIHADSAGQALSRFTKFRLQADVGLPYPAIRALIAESVELVVHLARDGARRVVRELARVERYDHTSDRYVLTAVRASAT